MKLFTIYPVSLSTMRSQDIHVQENVIKRLFGWLSLYACVYLFVYLLCLSIYFFLSLPPSVYPCVFFCARVWGGRRLLVGVRACIEY